MLCCELVREPHGEIPGVCRTCEDFLLVNFQCWCGPACVPVRYHTRAV
jgi:hypothetical protein